MYFQFPILQIENQVIYRIYIECVLLTISRISRMGNSVKTRNYFFFKYSREHLFRSSDCGSMRRTHSSQVLFYKRQMCLAEVSFTASTMDDVCATKWRKCENDNRVSTSWENQQRNDEERPLGRIFHRRNDWIVLDCLANDTCRDIYRSQ